MKKWRYVLATDLSLFNLGIIFFTLLPIDTINWKEATLATTAALALYMVICHAIRPHTWCRYGYLLSGWIGVLAFLAFETANTPAPAFVKIGVGFFFLSGTASGYSAYLVDGGRRGADQLD